MGTGHLNKVPSDWRKMHTTVSMTQGICEEGASQGLLQGPSPWVTLQLGLFGFAYPCKDKENAKWPQFQTLMSLTRSGTWTRLNNSGLQFSPPSKRALQFLPDIIHGMIVDINVKVP